MVAVDMSSRSAAFHMADRRAIVPRCTSPDFVPAVLDVCRRDQISLIVPTIDPELPVYAEARPAFAEAGVTVAISSRDVIRIGSDKVATHTWLTANGFPTVQQRMATDVCLDGDFPFPAIIKPRFGSSSIGVSVVRSHRELLAARPGADYIIQTIARGEEYTIDFLANRDGLALCAVPRKRLEVRGGEVSKGMTVKAPILERLASNLCAALPGAFGSLNVQVFWDQATDEMNIIEINPRFGGGFPLAWEAGGHFPKWIIEGILGLPSTADSKQWRGDLMMLRYDAGVFVEK